MKRLISILAFTILANMLFAQIHWGVSGGITSATVLSKTELGGDNTTDITGIASPHFGFFIEPQLTKNLSLETGVIYDKRGFSKREYYYPYDIFVTYDYVMPYVGVPLNLNIYIVNRGFKLYASVGQNIGLTFDGEKSVGENFSYSSSDGIHYDSGDFSSEEVPVGEDGLFKAFNYDFVVGIGIGAGRFYLTYNFNMGVGNFSNMDIMDYRSRVQNLSLKIDFSKNKN